MAHLDGVLGITDPDARLKALKQTHPIYDRYVQSWQIGLDAYDGTGGFLDGSYLWKFPREEQGDYDKRRAQARYHNYVETLVDIYLRSLLADVERTTADSGLQDWWTDVDGRGATIDGYLEGAVGQALASGHAGILMDRAPDLPTGPSRLDDRNRPYLATFSSPAILDWRVDRHGLAAVKLSEAAPVGGLDQAVRLDRTGFLLWDREQWARFDHEGTLLGTAEHALGVVPLEILRPKPSRRHPFLGKPLVTASVVRAFFNRASEEDIVLRDQAFSMFVVQVPQDATEEDIQQVRKALGSGVGTTTVTIVKGTADFKTADMQVPATIRENQQFLIAELYRMAHLRYQRDSLEAESAEAIRLQRQDLDATLRSMAVALHDLELNLARLYFRWTVPDAADRMFDRAKVEISYPDTYALPSLETELTSWAAAIAMQLGPTATREIKQRAVTLVLPDVDQTTLEAIRAELEAGDLTGPRETARESAMSRLSQLGVAVA